MSRGVCMTRAPVVRVRGGWGGTHLRYLAVKSAVRYWAHTTLPLDSSLTLMEWGEEVFKSLSIGGWQIWEGVPPPQLLLVCYEHLPTTIQGEREAMPFQEGGVWKTLLALSNSLCLGATRPCNQ